MSEKYLIAPGMRHSGVEKLWKPRDVVEAIKKWEASHCGT